MSKVEYVTVRDYGLSAYIMMQGHTPTFDSDKQVKFILTKSEFSTLFMEYNSKYKEFSNKLRHLLRAVQTPKS